MCFVLYIATPRPLPIVPWDDAAPAVHTAPLSEFDQGVVSHFRLPNVSCLGSDTHCGCGFRNASYQSGSWPEEEWRPDGDRSHIEAQPNHERLVQLIRAHLGGEAEFELYGTWDADLAAPVLSRQTIGLDRLLDLDFYFRDRGHYIVRP